MIRDTIEEIERREKYGEIDGGWGSKKDRKNERKGKKDGGEEERQRQGERGERKIKSIK